MEQIAFTLCSNNYLAQAKTLAGSLRRHNPEFKFYIGLVDRRAPGLDYESFAPAEVIELDDRIISGYGDMISRYDVIELNTAVKPFFFQYLIRQHPAANVMYFFDPDVRIYAGLDYLNRLLEQHDVLLTPHFYTPPPVDELHPGDPLVLNHGIYNLGFLGVQPQSAEVGRLLEWWGERTFKLGYINLKVGLFVDQLWLNLAPLYFKNVHVVRHHGCNMAPWNLHERSVKHYAAQDNVVLNNDEPLIFYHFSSCDIANFDQLSKIYNRNTFPQRADLKPLYDEYRRTLFKSDYEIFAAIPNALDLKWSLKPPPPPPQSIARRTLAPVVRSLRRVWQHI